MEPQMLQSRKMTIEDLPAFQQMDTGIDDDYVLRIYDKLMDSPTQELYGLFQNHQLLSVAGYSLFGKNQFAMLGRLRSDRNYRSKGYATQLLRPVINDLRKLPKLKWVGANTHVHNFSARRLLEKSGLSDGQISYYLTLTAPGKLSGHTRGERWKEIYETAAKRSYLLALSNNELGLFPYECYYPFPFDSSFFTNQYLQDSNLYVNLDRSRFVLIKNDQKKYNYSHVKYFWNDHYTQPGFFETLLHHWRENPKNIGCWIDFSTGGYHNNPDLTPYEVQDPWIQYGLWI
ncbi:GNAT family N-acetyltransferase [Halobacillus sp. Marseille-Q1614]|uniref:GNAT family N-acetyltransferase n=1 Tax=Halobacillus sp. Marseille-Q1614 TaxID=2709134 RepID=UPI00156DE912|nr:GNAT family N-acetyltransferase [Halobacillus sp. Marseille-Q1614]